MAQNTNVTITGEYIELNKLLKFESLVDSGGHAKQVIADGLVFVNGEVATQTRKKIINGDVVEFNGEYLRIHAN
ncbi:MAG: RNA-binding S4 domain-containing protein [Gammaproteobacteria bacterium]|nr:RNA-binding S4 domain-containing protein [Gammaproteobacteria bacterium]